MYVQLTTNFQLLPRLGVWDSQKRERELVLFPTNLTFFWDREILCASTEVGHLQVQLPLAGLCWLCCAWVGCLLYSGKEGVFFFNLGIGVFLILGRLYWVLLEMVIAALGFVGLAWGLLWGAGDIGQRGFFGLF